MATKKSLINDNTIRGIASVLNVFPDRIKISEQRIAREKIIRKLFISESPANAFRNNWQNVGNYMWRAIERLNEEEQITQSKYYSKYLQALIENLGLRNIK